MTINTMREKRGQVTLFIILGIIIVGGIVATSVFLLNTEPATETPEILGPRGFVSKCVKDAVEDSVEKIIIGGGEISPDFTIRYLGNNYTYHCYQGSNYKSCLNIQPMLETKAGKRLVSDTTDAVANCFNEMLEDFENRGYNVVGDTTYYSIDVLPETIKVNLKKAITISDDKTSQDFENFDINVISPLYDLIRISREIVNSETEYCYFEKEGFMMLNPEYSVTSAVFQDSKLYEVIDRKSNIEFKFAVRGCVLPASLI